LEVLGPNLDSLLKHHPGFQIGEPWEHRFPKHFAKRVLRDTLLGLDFPHSHGVVHGDLHPGNILASRAAQAWGWTYLAGLWKEQLTYLLLWIAGAIPSVGGGERHSTYYCPRWSWASLDGCQIRHIAEPMFEFSIAVREAHCTPRRGNAFGSPKDGQLEVDGMVARAAVSEEMNLDISGRDLKPAKQHYRTAKLMKAIIVVPNDVVPSIESVT
jgi:serine/threonine protein kinase